MFGGDRDSLRQFYYDVWDKLQIKAPLTALEQQLATVILEHPEYHVYLQSDARKPATALYLPEDDSNPFMHMGLHLAIRDQVDLDRPQGMQKLFNQLLTQTQDKLAAEHRLLPILAEALAEAMGKGAWPDEQVYLARVRQKTSSKTLL